MVRSGRSSQAAGEQEEAEPTSGAGGLLPAPRLGRVILLAALLCYVSVTMLNILSSHVSRVEEGAALLGLFAIFGLQLHHSRPGANAASPRSKCLTLGAQALLTYLPLILFRSQWGSMAGFLAGSLLLLLSPRSAWIMYGAVGLSMLAPPLLTERPMVDTFYFVQSTLLTGLVVYGLTRLVDLIRVLHETRGELTRVAVTRERLRFARDLHDLLGYSLSAITLKGELIHRLLPAHPARAKTEVEDVLAMSRQSLADVRSVASGYRDMSLQEEISSAESVLNAADVRVTSRIRIGTVGQTLDTVFATVLREAVTNVLRHSRATHCEIVAEQDGERMSLSVSNDGVTPGYRDPSPHSGTGLGNLELRLSAVNGTLTVEREGDGTFRLTATAPLAGVDDSESLWEGPTAGNRAAA
ncbi:sensor histidine kinase [Streptomyces olivochromogenes]|uniref:Two-component sensor histidine kinase n=1 Tax=Streptomyces olivochromogenes TaxID=1963 RepID=A0A250VCF9_STROL|nr:histidine kinase [Streptomyces olivochromogenes]GAX51762.1 two-component sensor histidine kinase [Streptomyces olivochromogenes]